MLTAASASIRPQPKVLLGIWLPGTPPQVWVLVRGTAVCSIRDSTASTSPCQAGIAESRSATWPATCGPAIEVPLIVP